MKKGKKLLNTLLSAVMVATPVAGILSQTVPALAAKITISDNGAKDAKYVAYKLMNVTNSGDENQNFAYTLNETYAAILKSVAGLEGDADDQDVVDYLRRLDNDGVRAFADAVYDKIQKMDPDVTFTGTVADGIEQGYYLIVEIENGEDPDTYSLVMLDTAGNEATTVKTKEDVPEVDKQVEEKNDTTGASGIWGESADYDIGDVINYVLTGTVSAEYANYKSYFYKFIDTLSDGLTYNGDAKVYVVNGDEKIDITEYFTISHEAGVLTISILDLKAIEAVVASSKIVVEYTASLNENAVSGAQGNPNDVVLQFNNDPYFDGKEEPEEPGETPKDTNIVFTFDVIVNKVDANSQSLAGAGFTLYKKMANGSLEVVKEITAGDTTTFEFNGLDAGEYVLKETTVPDGYNKAADIEFEIVPEYDTDKDPVELKDLKVQGKNADDFTVDLTPGDFITSVVNNTGTELPETGGTGTTLLYAVGGVVLVGGAGLLMFSFRKKREE